MNRDIYIHLGKEVERVLPSWVLYALTPNNKINAKFLCRFGPVPTLLLVLPDSIHNYIAMIFVCV